MPIFARVSTILDIAEQMEEVKGPDKSATGSCSRRVSALAFLVC